MSLYLRLVIGPLVICDLEMFATKSPPGADVSPPQLNGGSGAVVEPWVDGGAVVFGFGPTGPPSA